MKYSYNWLRELTGTKKSPKDLVEMVGLKSFELDGMEDLGKRFDGFVVGEVLEVKKHPDADKLSVCKVDVGNEVLQIVCGAPNVAEGQKVPVALVGAIVPLGGFKITKTKLRGVESKGMICAEDELGLGKDHKGILVLNEKLKAGVLLAEALELNDSIIDFDILPDRAHDCLSHEGMAREICAMEGGKFSAIDYRLRLKDGFNSDELKIKIVDKKACSRYIGAILDDVEVKESPTWLKTKLIASGMEPINNVVDITNYVMLEIGNPMHAFDFGKLRNEKGTAEITVRVAEKNERLELLDGKTLELSENDLVIASSKKPLALAGIKGGKDSGISAETKKIILESANFKGFNVRKSRQRHSLNTESQIRFEKELASELAERALVRAIDLLEKYAGAKIVEVVDKNYTVSRNQIVKLEFNYLNNLLGHEVEQEKVVQILGNLGFIIKGKSKLKIEVEVPFWRLDIEGKEDLIEEVGRIIGYEKIENRKIIQSVEVPKGHKLRSFEWKVRDSLTGLGLDEVLNYSFYSLRDVETCGILGGHFEIKNPLTVDQNLMRRSLIPGLLRQTRLNIKNFNNFSLFEIGRVYEPEKDNSPKERAFLAGAYFENNSRDGESFYFLKGKLEAFFGRVSSRELSFKRKSEFKDKIYHPSRTASIFLGKEKIGLVGQIERGVAKFYGIKKSVIVFEIDLEKLQDSVADEVGKVYSPSKKFPTVLRDLSMFVDYKTEVDQVTDLIQRFGGKKLLEVKLFDVYVDRKGEKKSLAFHLKFGKKERTLSGDEVDRIIKKMIDSLERKKVEVRKENE